MKVSDGSLYFFNHFCADWGYRQTGTVTISDSHHMVIVAELVQVCNHDFQKKKCEN